MQDANWFHVFESSSRLWLTDSGDWSAFYHDAAEISEYTDAVRAAKVQLQNWRGLDDPIIIVLGDFGQVEV